MEVISIIVLLTFGLILIFAEVIFVPGTTFVGLAGVVFSGVGVFLTFKNFGQSMGWIILSANSLLILWSLIYGLRGNAWKRFSLKSSMNSKFNGERLIKVNIGDIGETLSDLRPLGKAEFENQILEVKTMGTFVKAGSKVKIIKLESNSIFVETLTY